MPLGSHDETRSHADSAEGEPGARSPHEAERWQGALPGGVSDATVSGSAGAAPASELFAIAPSLRRRTTAMVDPVFGYAVSDALPLHWFGLVPPPPEIGAHLLFASPLEAAAAAAIATAAEMSMGSAEPQPADVLGGAPTTDTLLAGDAEPPGTSEGSLHFVGPDAEIDPLAMVPSAEVANDSDDLHAAPRAVAATQKLATLDLSRRHDTFSASPPDLPTVDAAPQGPDIGTLTIPSTSSLGAALGVNAPAAIYPGAGPAAPEPATSELLSNWMGFLAGFAVALVIGVGIYVTLARV